MKSFSTAFGVAAFASTVAGHGYITSPQPREPGDAMIAACGKQVANTFSSDINGNIQGVLQIAPSQSDYDADKCNIWTCKGMQFDDNTDNVQSWTAGEKVPMKVNIAAPHTGTANVSIIDTASSSPIGEPLIAWSVYASTATGVQANQTSFDVTIPSDLGSKCSTAGACTLQWWWDSREADQTYESCVDFTVGGSGSGSSSGSSSGSAQAATSTQAAASSTKAASSASATATAATTPVNNVLTTSAAATAAASSTATPSQGSSSTLPEEFTAEQFISWFKQVTGVTNARRSLRSHPRAF
ncbi:hypothetical protein P280DRAFT_465386 [Massarina eburnea CBS 473.64]|uniref:Chitin-binding type-4 domain-containing protein n=1 Tax=Massarina eburnea CBS 473.64 TaxID=1395130 RepID=A0A6A6SGL3_9PLEO|nr:hypothetical protein P280DRAFT_465386 [Massarina eburnea CBS 473.64]